MTELPVVPTETFLSTSVQLLLPLAGQIDAELVSVPERVWPVIVASTKSPFTAFEGTPTVTEEAPPETAVNVVLSFVPALLGPMPIDVRPVELPEGVPLTATPLVLVVLVEFPAAMAALTVLAFCPAAPAPPAIAVPAFEALE